MKTALSQMLNATIDTPKKAILNFQLQSSLLKNLSFLAALILIAFFNGKMAIALFSLGIIVKTILYIKDLMTIDIDFTLDSESWAEINEQMWS